LHNAANVAKARKALLTAFKVQMAGIGFSLVEMLSACPTNWGMKPVDALKWVEEKMVPYYRLGEFKAPKEAV